MLSTRREQLVCPAHLETAGTQPPLHLLTHCRPGWKSLGHTPPLIPGLHDVPDRVEQLPHIMFTSSVVLLAQQQNGSTNSIHPRNVGPVCPTNNVAGRSMLAIKRHQQRIYSGAKAITSSKRFGRSGSTTCAGSIDMRPSWGAGCGLSFTQRCRSKPTMVQALDNTPSSISDAESRRFHRA